MVLQRWWNERGSLVSLESKGCQTFINRRTARRQQSRCEGHDLENRRKSSRTTEKPPWKIRVLSGSLHNDIKRCHLTRIQSKTNTLGEAEAGRRYYMQARSPVDVQGA